MLVLLVGAVSVTYWPGHMSNDTLTQLAQVHGDTLTDFHTPVLVALWRLSWAVLPGPWYALLATVALFVASVYVLVRAALRPVAALVATVAVTVSPMMLGYLGVLSRDTWFTVLTLAAFAALVAAGVRAGRARVALVAVALAFSWLAVGARQNGFPVALVAAVLGARLLLDSLPRRGVLDRRGAGAFVAVALFAAVMGSQLLFVRLALRPAPRHPEQAVLLFDLVGISVREGEALLPPEVYPLQDVDALRRRTGDTTIAGAIYGPEAILPFPVADEHLDELRDAWWRAVRQHPAAYADTRWDQWLAQLGWTRNVLWVQHPSVDPNPWRYRPTFHRLDAAANDYVAWTASTPGLDGGLVHEVWVYLLVDVAGVGYLRSRNLGRRAVGGLALAAVLYEGTLLLAGTGSEYRFGLLTVAAGLVAGIVAGHDAVAGAVARRRSRTAAPALAG